MAKWKQHVFNRTAAPDFGGLLASAIPYGLDMIALPRLPAQTFSTLMSLSPVFAVFSGLIMLHEQLTHYQWLAIMCIIVSSIGTVLTMYH